MISSKLLSNIHQWVQANLLFLPWVFLFASPLLHGTRSSNMGYYYFCLSAILAAIFTSFTLIKRNSLKFSLIDLFVFLFTLTGIVVTFQATGKISSKTILLIISTCSYFTLRLYLQPSRNAAEKLLILIILAGLVEGVIGLRQLYGLTTSQHFLYRVTGTFENPGPFAGFLGCVLPLALDYIIRNKDVVKQTLTKNNILSLVEFVLVVFGFTVILTILPVTKSRTAWVASAASLTLVIIGHVYREPTFKKYFKSIIATPTKLLTVVILFISFLTISASALYHLKKDSADGRLLLWKLSVNTMTENIHGVGIGYFSGAMGKQQEQYFASQKGSNQEIKVADSPIHAFNDFLQIGAELGIAGLILILLIFIFSIRNGLKDRMMGPLAALVSLSIFAFGSYPMSLLPFVLLTIFFVAALNTNSSKVSYGSYELRFSRGVGLVFLVFSLCVVLLMTDRCYRIYKAYPEWELATYLFYSGHYKQALEIYNKEFQFLDDKPRFLFEYAQCLAKVKNFDESNKILSLGTQVSGDPMFHNVLGKNYQELKLYHLAEKHYIKAINTVPNRMYSYYLLATFYNDTGNRKNAVKIARRIVEMQPKVHSEATKQMQLSMSSFLKVSKNHSLTTAEPLN